VRTNANVSFWAPWTLWSYYVLRNTQGCRWTRPTHGEAAFEYWYWVLALINWHTTSSKAGSLAVTDRHTPLWKAVAVVRTGPCAMQQEELPEAQRAARGAAGTVPEQRAQGALRPARAQRADSRGDATETNKKANAARHDETH